jgi:uncharacterized membrane protein YbaN (DUF454 family)
VLHRWLALLLWRALALLCVLLGFVGIFVPGLPTVPFLLVAAWAGGKGWPALEAWLVNHPRHGPAIRRWRDRRAVPRRAKWAAGATMLVSLLLIWLSAAPPVLKIAMSVFLAAVWSWLWRRPEV